MQPILVGMSKGCSASVGVAAVQVEVEIENVHRWLTEEAEGATTGVRINDSAKLRDADTAGLRHSCHL
jgi:hypothetical protein